MDWLKIGSALLLVAMLFFLFPHAKSAIANSPKGSTKDWMGYILPMAIVVLFVLVLIAIV